MFSLKSLGKSLSGIIGTLSVLVSIATAYFFSGIAAQPEGIRISLLTGFKSVLSMLILDFNWTNCLFYGCFCNWNWSLIHLYSISYMHDDENMHKFCVFESVYILHDYISNRK
jgi:NADH-quinone oxidoreductase subunit L